MIRRLIPFVAVVALTLGLGACKSPEEKACANLKDLAEKLGEKGKDFGDETKCVAQMKEFKDECKNGDAVIECLGSAKGDDEEAAFKSIMECVMKCEEK